MNTEREIMKQIALKHIPEWVAENIKAGEKTFTSEFECMLAAMAEYGQHQAATIADLQQQNKELREALERIRTAAGSEYIFNEADKALSGGG
jgi:glucosamine 6-phosphate synthetase-like amidotransferase/phosphosugar isomerase protein